MPATIEEYIAGFPTDVQPLLEQVAGAFRRALPGAEEKIRYGMPALMFQDRYGVHFAGWKHHVGIYPVGPLPPELEAEVAPHRAKKDTVRFEYRDPIPVDLIERIVTALRDQHR